MPKSQRSLSASAVANIPELKVPDAPAELECFITWHEVHRRTSLSKSTVYSLMHARLFPQNIAIPNTKLTVRWLLSEINEWMKYQALISRSPDAPPRQTRAGPGRGHKGKMQPVVAPKRKRRKVEAAD